MLAFARACWAAPTLDSLTTGSGTAKYCTVGFSLSGVSFSRANSVSLAMVPSRSAPADSVVNGGLVCSAATTLSQPTTANALSARLPIRSSSCKSSHVPRDEFVFTVPQSTRQAQAVTLSLERSANSQRLRNRSYTLHTCGLGKDAVEGPPNSHRGPCKYRFGPTLAKPRLR
jgi:hypothetical protein